MKLASSIAHEVREGARTAVDVLDETIAGIEHGQGRTNSFTGTTFERARREAVDLDRRRERGESLPPLAGVPYAVKNLFDVESVVTLAGAKVNASNAPACADAALVARMRESGALLVGTLNMDEYAYGFTSENTHFGVTRNPHDAARVAGGSSGGSAAAIADGLVPLTLGSDTNGSIRVPASLCGTFGLKPTFGRLSRRGCFPFVASLDHVGPFASSASDLAAAYDALQMPDAADAASPRRNIERVLPLLQQRPERPLRVAVLGGYFADWSADFATSATQRVAAALQAAGTVRLEGAQRLRSAAFVLTAAEAGALHRAPLRTHYADYEPLSRDRLIAGSLVPASWVVQAQRIRREGYLEAMKLFEHFDVLIAAATPVQATLIGQETLTLNGQTLGCRPSMGLLTQPISCIGLPVCVVPLWPQAPEDNAAHHVRSGAAASVGSARAEPTSLRAPQRTPAERGPRLPQPSHLPHLPIGVQLIAAPWREDLCLRAAKQLEDAGVARCRIG